MSDQVINTCHLLLAEEVSLCPLEFELFLVLIFIFILFFFLLLGFCFFCLRWLDYNLRFLSVWNIVQSFPWYEVRRKYFIVLVFLSFALKETFYIFVNLLLLRKQQRGQWLLNCDEHVNCMAIVR